eukprot:592135-Prymnesium_polylepis.1
MVLLPLTTAGGCGSIAPASRSIVPMNAAEARRDERRLLSEPRDPRDPRGTMLGVASPGFVGISTGVFGVTGISAGVLGVCASPLSSSLGNAERKLAINRMTSNTTGKEMIRMNGVSETMMTRSV